MEPEGVGTAPLPENVDGRIVEDHRYIHNVDHSVRWDYVLGVLVVLLVAWLLFGGSSGSTSDVDDDDAGGSEEQPFSGLQS